MTTRYYIHSLLFTAATAMLASCGGGNSGGGNNSVEAGDFDDLSAWRASSPVSGTLKGCVTAENNSESCALSALPLIGMNNPSPTKSQILDHLIVSHDWMGERFEQVLDALPEQMLPLFRSVTAIVIDDDIRPAYYTTQTGAIYLDPAYLWLTPQEAGTINRKQDFRSGFSDPLAFRSLGRYVKDSNYAYRGSSLENPSPRTIDDVLLSLSRLLLHELAHANDFFPPEYISTINSSRTTPQAHIGGQAESIAGELTNEKPLSSDLWFDLAGVMYRGNTATQNETSVTSSQAASAFDVDGAVDDYAYTSIYEDVAMLFEEAMMKYFYDVDKDIAYTEAPPEGLENDARGYVVDWGVRGRIGDAEVKDRAQQVVERIFPDIDFNAFFNELAAPQNLDMGVNWNQSLTITNTAGPRLQDLQKPSAPVEMRLEDLLPPH